MSMTAAANKLGEKKASVQTMVSDGLRYELLPELGPEFAKTLLSQQHPNQRPIRRSHVVILARDMKYGRWRRNGDTIKLDKELRVIDGQHRLHAIVESGVTLHDVPVVIVQDDAAIRSIDQGLPRNLQDVMVVDGLDPMRRTLTGAIFAEHSGWSDWRTISREEQLAILKTCPYEKELRALYSASGKGGLATVGSMSGALRCLRKNREGSLAFFSAVFAMNPVVDGLHSPQAKLLYTTLANMRGGKKSTSSVAVIREIAYKTVRAWNMYREGTVASKYQYYGSPVPEANP